MSTMRMTEPDRRRDDVVALHAGGVPELGWF